MSTSSREVAPERHVAIVGGGLVGILAVLYFAKRGWTVSLFELREGSFSIITIFYIKAE
jgi:2-polyprenyl-6-methoxyphenol hydroxylase-like FAD-dependent oxidoreductase